MEEFSITNLCGWVERKEEVDRICTTLPVPVFDTPEPDNKLELATLVPIHDSISNYKLGTQIQQIGDCVSFGFKHLTDITQARESNQAIQNAIAQFGVAHPQFNAIKARALLDYQEAASEVIYALSRVEIGGQRGSYEDGSVGSWAAKALNLKGFLSRPNLKLLGENPDYDPRRAKEWGAKGLPDQYEPEAFKHIFETVSLVRNFKEAAWHIQNGRAVAVCSNVGFENNGGRTKRDSDGFARAAGRWDHCMCFVAVRMGRRPGLGLLNQWPYSMTSGPKGFPSDPDNNFWWVDVDTCNRMLGQGDSWTGERVKGYPPRRIWRT